jgi:hypothetical protein
MHISYAALSIDDHNRSANSAHLREIEGGLFALFALFADS